MFGVAQRVWQLHAIAIVWFHRNAGCTVPDATNRPGAPTSLRSLSAALIVGTTVPRGRAVAVGQLAVGMERGWSPTNRPNIVAVS